MGCHILNYEKVFNAMKYVCLFDTELFPAGGWLQRRLKHEYCMQLILP